MSKYSKLLSIPIVEAGSNRIAGSMCSTMDAVTQEELETLEHLRTLHQQAREIKKKIKVTDKKAQEALSVKLEELRVQAKYWQEQRKEATKNKNTALGHTILPIDAPK
jgi:uncharacterized lipoprotein YehR (DUF1307 family)